MALFLYCGTVVFQHACMRLRICELWWFSYMG